MEGVSATSDGGTSYILKSLTEIEKTDGKGGLAWREGMKGISEKVDVALFGPLED